MLRIANNTKMKKNNFGEWTIPELKLVWGSTATLFYQFVKAVCTPANNRTAYCDKAGRVYVYNGKWIRRKRGMKRVCQRLLDTLYPLFVEHVKSKEMEVKALKFGDGKWTRIESMWLHSERPVKYWGRQNVTYDKSRKSSHKHSAFLDMEYIFKSTLNTRA